VLIIVDQVTKYFAYTRLQPIGSITVIENVFNFTYLENHGAAFGLFQGARWFFVVITVFIMCGMIYYYVKLPKDKAYNKARIALLLVMAGAIGNFIDRVRNGFVIDMFHVTFIDFPVFNVADILVVIGVFLMFILLIFVHKEDFK
jgi:signal peptidase II